MEAVAEIIKGSWQETENEIRYINLAPEAFIAGSLLPSKHQEKPEIGFIKGTLKQTEDEGLQAIIFSKDEWTFDQAQTWWNENRDSLAILQKTMDINMDFFNKNGFSIQQMIFDKNHFSKIAVEKFMASKQLDTSTLIEKDGNFVFDIRPIDQLLSGSIRDIPLRSGVNATVGTLKQEFQKNNIEKRLPDRFALNGPLFKLSDLDVDEVTLTRSPAVGRMAEFRLMKSLTGGDSFEINVPICKVNLKKGIVGAYVLVPGIPDIQNHMASKEEIERGCHSFQKNLCLGKQKGSGTGHEHSVFSGIGHSVENFVDVEGTHGVKGGWFLMVKVTDPQTLQSVEKGEIVGFSLGGRGKLEKVDFDLENLNLQKAHGDVEKISLLRRIAMKLGIKLAETQESHEELQEQREDIEPASLIEQLANEGNRVDKSKTSSSEGEQQKSLEEVQLSKDFEIMTKFNLRATEFNSLKQKGVNLEGVCEHLEGLRKSLNMTDEQLLKALNISPRVDPGMTGWAGMSLVQTVMDNELSLFSPGGTSNLSKTAGNEVDAEKDELRKMVSPILKRLEFLEGQPATNRQSTSNLTDQTPVQKAEDPENDFMGLDTFNISVKQCQESLEKSGFIFD